MSDTQGQKVALECAVETQRRGQQDMHPLEDTASPVEVQDTVTQVVSVEDAEIVTVEDRLHVLPLQETDPVRDHSPRARRTPPGEAAEEEASRLVPRWFRERLAGPEECFLQYLSPFRPYFLGRSAGQTSHQGRQEQRARVLRLRQKFGGGMVGARGRPKMSASPTYW